MPGGYVQNTYTLKILNMSDDDREYIITVEGLPLIAMMPDNAIAVAAGEIGEVSASIVVNPDELGAVVTGFRFVVSDDELTASSDSRFLGPEPLEDAP